MANQKNVARCKCIADRLEQIANLELHRCPECNKYIERDGDQYNCRDEVYTCQECGETFDEGRLELVWMCDFFEYYEDVFDVEFRIGQGRQYRSVCIMVAAGGPNVYVDTSTKAVELYWSGERAMAYLSEEACGAIDEAFESVFERG